MVEKVQFSGSDTAAAVRAANEYRGRATSQGGDNRSGLVNANPHDLVRSRVIDGALGTVGNGPVVASGGVVRASSAMVKDGTVDLGNGMVTSVEAALANGWIKQGSDGGYILTDGDFAPADQQTQDNRQQQQPKLSADEIEQKETQLLFEHADSLIGQMTSSIPAQHREALMEGAVMGDIDGLAQAIGSEPVNTLVAAYSKQADMIASEHLGFKAKGVAELASEVLAEDELSMMREALLNGNRHGVKHCVALTMQALDDAERSEGLLQDLEEQGATVVRHGNRTATITLPNGVQGSIASLLRGGYIHFG